MLIQPWCDAMRLMDNSQGEGQARFERAGDGGPGSGLTDATRSSHQSQQSPSRGGELCSCLEQQLENRSSRKQTPAEDSPEVLSRRLAGMLERREGHLPWSARAVREGSIVPASPIRKIIIREKSLLELT